MNEIISRNELTIEEHVQRIKLCLDRTRQSIFDTVISIKECRDQVGDEVFQKEISTRLGMSPSTLNRWLSIGNSQFVMSHQDKVPTTFTGLYYLTQLEKKYSEYYSRDGLQRLEKLLQDGKIHENTQQTDIQEILNKISNQIKKRKKKEREKNIVDLVGGSIGSDDRSTTLDELIDSRSMFRCVFVDLKKDLISRWGDQGFFETDIQSEFPLHELRTPSITETVTCLIRVPMKKIDVGIKVLSSFGFNYRDTFVPSSKSDDMFLLDNQDVLIRGERGGGQRLVDVHLQSSKTKDVLDFCESEFEGPFLVVFDEVDRSNWVCITK
jgi:DNA-binding transcriptional ArsR family regulator